MGFFDGPFLNTMGGGMPTIPQAPKPTVPTMGASAMSEGAALGKSITPTPVYSPPPTPAPPVSTPAPVVIPKPAPPVSTPAPVVIPKPAAPVATTSGANITSDENQGFAQASLGGMAQVQPTPSIQPPAPVTPTGGPGGGFGETTQPAQPTTPTQPAAPTSPLGGPGGGLAETTAMPQAQTITPPQPSTPVSPVQPAAPTPPMGGPGGGASETVGGTALTPAAPSATGGGTGALPTATIGGGDPIVAGVSEKFDAVEPTGMGTEPQSLGFKSSTAPVNVGVTGTITAPKGEGTVGMAPAQATGNQLEALTDVTQTQFDAVGTGGPALISDTVINPTASTAPTTRQGVTSESLLGATTGGDIAALFGFDPGQYGGYFTPISEGMKKAGTEEGYSGMMGEQRAQLRQQAGQSRQGLRASLLQDAMMAQQQAGASGFAGGGAQDQALGLARAGRQLSADQLAAQYGRGMYGVRQQIAGRVAAGQQALSQAQKSMYDRALQLQRSGAAMDYMGGPVSGGTTNTVLGMTQAESPAIKYLPTTYSGIVGQ